MPKHSSLTYDVSLLIVWSSFMCGCLCRVWCFNFLSLFFFLSFDLLFISHAPSVHSTHDNKKRNLKGKRMRKTSAVVSFLIIQQGMYLLRMVFMIIFLCCDGNHLFLWSRNPSFPVHTIMILHLIICHHSIA